MILFGENSSWEIMDLNLNSISNGSVELGYLVDNIIESYSILLVNSGGGQFSN